MICKVRQILLLWAAALALAGCGGGVGGGGPGSGESDLILKGTAATGAPIVGAEALAIGGNGRRSSPTTTDTNGDFSLVVNGLTYPILVKVVSGGQTLFGWGRRPGHVNVTALTTAALVLLPDLPKLSGVSDNLDHVFDNWQVFALSFDDEELIEAQETINANLSAAMVAAGLKPKTYDFVRTPFTADGTGIDSVLDGFNFEFDFSNTSGVAVTQSNNGVVVPGVVTITLKSDNSVVPFDADISTEGFTVGGSDGDDDDTPPTVCIESGAAVYTFDLDPAVCSDPVLVGFNGTGSAGGLGGLSTLLSATDTTRPADSHGRIVKVVRSATADEFAGTIVILEPPLVLPFTEGSKKMSVRVWTPIDRVKVQLKVDNSVDFGKPGEVFSIAEKEVRGFGWQTVEFDFARPVFSSSDPVTSALDPSQTFNRVTVSFDVGKFGSEVGERTYYFDEISFPHP